MTSHARSAGWSAEDLGCGDSVDERRVCLLRPALEKCGASVARSSIIIDEFEINPDVAV